MKMSANCMWNNKNVTTVRPDHFHFTESYFNHTGKCSEKHMQNKENYVENSSTIKKESK